MRTELSNGLSVFAKHISALAEARKVRRPPRHSGWRSFDDLVPRDPLEGNNDHKENSERS